MEAKGSRDLKVFLVAGVCCCCAVVVVVVVVAVAVVVVVVQDKRKHVWVKHITISDLQFTHFVLMAHV